MNKEDLILAFEDKANELGMCLDQQWGEYENPYTNSDTFLAYDLFKSGVQAQQQTIESLKAQLLKHQSDDYVLVKKDKIDVFWQDDDEPENFCSREEDLNVLAEACDVGDIMVINETHTAHIKTEKLFGVVVHGTDGLKLKVFDNYADAHKAMIEAQEQQ